MWNRKKIEIIGLSRIRTKGHWNLNNKQNLKEYPGIWFIIILNLNLKSSILRNQNEFYKHKFLIGDLLFLICWINFDSDKISPEYLMSECLTK